MQIPGFIDLQINGYKGVDFSSGDLTAENFIFAVREILKTGTAAFLPTVITSLESTYRHNLPIIAGVISMPEFKDKILGIHLEGPFISDKPGAVGAHNKQWTKTPSISYLDSLQELAGGNIKLLTVSAELSGVEGLIRYASKMGITVSLGHQLALEEKIEAAVNAGAKALTHLGNAMPNEVDRHRNTFLAGLANDNLTAMIITDGHHLPPSVIKTIVKTKGISKFIVVSDASPIAGMAPGNYDVLGNKAILETNGLLHNPEKKCMVGSSAMMVDCMNYLASLDLLTEKELLEACFYNPLKLIGGLPDSVKSNNAVIFNNSKKVFEVMP